MVVFKNNYFYLLNYQMFNNSFPFIYIYISKNVCRIFHFPYHSFFITVRLILFLFNFLFLYIFCLFLIPNYIILFKVFHSSFIFEILDKLLIKFEEKHIDLILSVLRTIGFNLRKDNPTLIKKLLLDIQKKSSDVCESTMR